MAIECLLTIKAVFHLAYRQTEGFANSLNTLLEIDLPIPDDTTLNRRASTLQISVQPMFTTLALGSNLGERRANLRNARHLLHPAFRETRVSPIYETDPWGYADQPAFLNQILQGETDLPPFDLLALCKRIERKLGRVPGIRYGPRPIDVDILLYGDVLLNTPELTLPHARLHERAFVLVPLCDLDPQRLHPQLGKTMAQLLANIDTAGVRPAPDSR